METTIKSPEAVFASKASALPDGLSITVEGKTYVIKWEDCSEKLAAASQDDRAQLELSPSGYGIHWKTLDEDLSVRGLLKKMRE